MKKILVVDDEQNIRDLLKDKLVKSNFAVTVASGGQEALAKCKDERPDLLLIDIAMPEMDGYETCKKLKQDRQMRDIPVLFLTGKDLEVQGVIEHCMNLGACGHISKLSTLKELVGKIEEITKGMK